MTCSYCRSFSKTAFAGCGLIAVAVWILLLAPPAQAQPVFNPATGHFYDVFQGSGNWASANTKAQAQSYLGIPAHLVTITSLQESLFITNELGVSAIQSRWIGAVQPPGSPEPAGGWTWVTGEPFVFTNWTGTEPSNTGGNESRITLTGNVGAAGSEWNDANAGFNAPGFVVEFEPPETGIDVPLQLDVTYTNGQIITGPLIGGLTELPDHVDVTFFLEGDPAASVFSLPDVTGWEVTFADVEASLEDLDNFLLLRDPDAGGAIVGLTYSGSFEPGIDIGNFPLTISGIDPATGQPFEYQYSSSTQALSALAVPEPASLAMWVVLAAVFGALAFKARQLSFALP